MNEDHRNDIIKYRIERSKEMVVWGRTKHIDTNSIG